MNSGKSTALMQVAHNYEEQGMRVLILKPQVDTKGGGELVSRLGVRRKADLLVPPEMDVFAAVQQAAAAAPLACVLCDESQFFTPQQADELFMVTVELNIPASSSSRASRSPSTCRTMSSMSACAPSAISRPARRFMRNVPSSSIQFKNLCAAHPAGRRFFHPFYE